MAAYEDPLYFLAKEQRLPINLTPGDNRLADAEARARLVRVFHRGLNKPSGYVLLLGHAGGRLAGRIIV